MQHRFVRDARVAVVIATYRRPQVLAVALRSLVAQTLTDWQALVVGDATEDDTAAVVASFGDPRIDFVDLAVCMGEQSGPNNVGIARTSAPLVAFLNHDDLWFPDHLAIAVDTLQARRADLVFSPNLTVHPSTSSPGAVPEVSVTVDSLSRGGRFDPTQTTRATPASTWLATREMLESLDGWRPASECVVEPSQDLLFRAHRRGHRLVSTGVATVITIASGTRAGSYARSTTEHQWFADRLHEPDFRARLLACDAVGCPKDTIGETVRRRVGQSTRRTLVALGVSPRALHYRVRLGLRPGDRLRQLHVVRGLGADQLGDLGATAASIRRHEVLRVCSVDAATPMEFGRDGNGHRFTALGWSVPEDWGVWSDGPVAELAVSTSAHGRFALVLELHAHVDSAHPRQRVITTVHGESSTTMIETGNVSCLTLPFTSSGTTPVIIELCLPDAWQPASGDPRRLSIGLHRARLEAL
ncbi:MAG: glycosyltransferase [Actinobacteria bacterium]|nr:glycosyltransferase [Actinomycetota bacterium]